MLFAVGVGTFMSALDGSIVNALLPVLRTSLRTDVAEIEWVITIYLLVVSGVLLAFGRLGDLRGHRDVYAAGFLGFALTSGLCGLAPSVQWLVAFRALQAIAAAMLFANAPAILTLSFPPSERGRALGLQATMTYLGLSVGPPLGGLLAGRLGWRAIFFVNVPIGVIGAWLSRRVIARDRPEDVPPRFDLAGAALFFVGLFALLLALNQGHDWGWSSAAVLSLVAAALATLAGFVALERRREHPMLDLSLFASRPFSGATFSALVSYIAAYAILFLVPFYLVQQRGLAPREAGVVLMAQPLVMMVSAPLAGALSDRIGSRGPSLAGLATLITGLLLLSRVRAETRLGLVAGALAVCGLGLGLFTTPNNSRLLGAAPPHRRGIASGVLAAARNVGMVIGVGIAGAVLTTVLARAGDHAVVAGVSRGLEVAAAITALGLVTTWLEPET